MTTRAPAVIDASTAAKLAVGGNVMWTCGHVGMWPGIDAARGILGPGADPARYPCPQCGTAGILGTADRHERPDIPRAPAVALVGRAACGHELWFLIEATVAPGGMVLCPKDGRTTLRDLQPTLAVTHDMRRGSRGVVEALLYL